VFNVLLDSLCTFKSRLEDVCESLMQVLYAHIGSPAYQRNKGKLM
jgi:hypothetical protein